MQLEWFDRWLKDSPHEVESFSGEAPLRVIEPGGHSYRTAAYPLADAQRLRLHMRSEGRLTVDTPDGAEPSDSVYYLPLGPACTTSTVQFAAGIGAEDCLRPQRRAERSLNEMTYSTEVLDAPLRLAGPILASLVASSSRPDAVFHVTIEDVGPDGRSIGLTGGAQLASLRAIDEGRSWFDPSGELLRPHHLLTEESSSPVPIGEPVRYQIEIRPPFATVPIGHRLRLRISTADFPHVVALADAAALQGGHQELLHSAATDSYVDLSVRPG